MAHSHGHGGHGHGQAQSDYDEEKVNQLKDDIKDVERDIRAAKRAKGEYDHLQDQLAELQSQLRRLEASDPIKQKKRRIAALRADEEIHDLEERAKHHHPHKKHWLIRLGFGGWVVMLWAIYVLFFGTFKNMFPAAVDEFACLVVVVTVWYGISKYRQLKSSSGGNKDSKQSAAAAHH